MFGMGFTEILIIAVIAILFLGPDKLPSAMVEVAKFFRNTKNAIGSVKDSLEQEMNVADIKQEALAYKKKLLEANDKIERAADFQGAINTHVDDLLNDDKIHTTKKEEPQEVTFKKKEKKSDKEENIDV
jgi:sec-independent protein translocase protein TatB